MHACEKRWQRTVAREDGGKMTRTHTRRQLTRQQEQHTSSLPFPSRLRFIRMKTTTSPFPSPSLAGQQDCTNGSSGSQASFPPTFSFSLPLVDDYLTAFNPSLPLILFLISFSFLSLPLLRLEGESSRKREAVRVSVSATREARESESRSSSSCRRPSR